MDGTTTRSGATPRTTHRASPACRQRPHAIAQRLRMLACIAAAGAALLAAAPARAAPPALGLHAGSDNDTSQYESFGQWLGRPVVYRVTFVDATSWKTIASPYFLKTTAAWLASSPIRVEVVTVPLLPAAAQPSRLADVAAGRHDEVFRMLAQRLQATGNAQRIIVRPGWEANGNWYPWSAVYAPITFIRAFRHVVAVMRSEAPRLRFEWNLSRQGVPSFDWTKAYPGDDVVDIVSMDVYDQYTNGWADLLGSSLGRGLLRFRAFAREHRKPEAYTEWSLSTSSHGRGDEPAFVDDMHAWLHDPKANVLYQSYWNTHAGGPDAAIQGPDAGNVPNAANEYRKLFSRDP